jgi:hypothetical protein
MTDLNRSLKMKTHLLYVTLFFFPFFSSFSSILFVLLMIRSIANVPTASVMAPFGLLRQMLTITALLALIRITILVYQKFQI